MAIPHYALRTRVEVPIDDQRLPDLRAAAKIKRPITGWMNHVASIDLTWGEIIRAAIMVGTRDWEERRKHAELGGLEIWRRALLILSHLALKGFDQSVGLVKTPVFMESDPTEKGAASYSIAMAMTLAIARRQGDAEALLHYDLHHGQIGRVRPDLVGASAPDSAFFEAKGRFGRVDQATMGRAVEQLRRHVLSPNTKFGAATAVGFYRDRLECYRQWVDYRTSASKFASIHAGQGRGVGPRPDDPIALALLYSGLTERRSLSTLTIAGVPFSVARNADLGLLVGLRTTRLQQLLETADVEWATQIWPYNDLPEARGTDLVEVDGVLLGWDGSRDVERLVDDPWTMDF